ncbi:hypothetical protein [Serratia aquatilis]|uniref:Uncharacterized protein n=1 Tax=Serratia aquatilis TaxID=1737515 RepID=A0ABV6EFJ3_9GAMM
MKNTSSNVMKRCFNHSELKKGMIGAGELTYIEGKVLLVNYSSQDVKLNNIQGTVIHPFSSLIRCNEKITPNFQLMSFYLEDDLTVSPEVSWENQEVYIGKVRNEEVKTGFENVNFYRSPSECLDIIHFEPLELVTRSVGPKKNQLFSVSANLWFAKAGTHCGIHNQHSFIEIHTQILGRGRMQSFYNEEYSSLCEEIHLAPGTTTSRAFCCIDDNGEYIYPFHQYYADTHSVWLAIEYSAVE